MMPSSIVLALYALAVARATTLITHDEITRPARAWLVDRFDPRCRTHRAMVYLLGEPDGDVIGCPWCISIWIGAMTAPVMYLWGDTPPVVIAVLALAVSQITGMIYTYGRQ